MARPASVSNATRRRIDIPKMKITKAQLKKIIQEELDRALRVSVEGERDGKYYWKKKWADHAPHGVRQALLRNEDGAREYGKCVEDCLGENVEPPDGSQSWPPEDPGYEAYADWVRLLKSTCLKGDCMQHVKQHIVPSSAVSSPGTGRRRRGDEDEPHRQRERRYDRRKYHP